MHNDFSGSGETQKFLKYLLEIASKILVPDKKSS